jgi:hypothetical protein
MNCSQRTVNRWRAPLPLECCNSARWRRSRQPYYLPERAAMKHSLGTQPMDRTERQNVWRTDCHRGVTV